MLSCIAWLSEQTEVVDAETTPANVDPLQTPQKLRLLAHLHVNRAFRPACQQGI